MYQIKKLEMVWENGLCYTVPIHEPLYVETESDLCQFMLTAWERVSGESIVSDSIFCDRGEGQLFLWIQRKILITCTYDICSDF